MVGHFQAEIAVDTHVLHIWHVPGVTVCAMRKNKHNCHQGQKCLREEKKHILSVSALQFSRQADAFTNAIQTGTVQATERLHVQCGMHLGRPSKPACIMPGLSHHCSIFVRVHFVHARSGWLVARDGVSSFATLRCHQVRKTTGKRNVSAARTFRRALHGSRWGQKIGTLSQLRTAEMTTAPMLRKSA